MRHLMPDERSLEDVRTKLAEVISVLNALEGTGRVIRVVSLHNAIAYRDGSINLVELEAASWLANLP